MGEGGAERAPQEPGPLSLHAATPTMTSPGQCGKSQLPGQGELTIQTSVCHTEGPEAGYKSPQQAGKCSREGPELLSRQPQVPRLSSWGDGPTAPTAPPTQGLGSSWVELELPEGQLCPGLSALKPECPQCGQTRTLPSQHLEHYQRTLFCLQGPT